MDGVKEGNVIPFETFSRCSEEATVKSKWTDTFYCASHAKEVDKILSAAKEANKTNEVIFVNFKR
jgi:hypothetical protein